MQNPSKVHPYMGIHLNKIIAIYGVMDDILQRFNPWWKSSLEFPGIPRETYLIQLENLNTTKDVVLLTGLRRVGKTTLLHQLIYRLLKKIERKN